MTTFKEQLALDEENVFNNTDEFGELHNIDGTPDIPCDLETVNVSASSFLVGHDITKCLIISVALFPGELFFERHVTIDGVGYQVGDFKSYPSHHEIYLSRYQG